LIPGIKAQKIKSANHAKNYNALPIMENPRPASKDRIASYGRGGAGTSLPALNANDI